MKAFIVFALAAMTTVAFASPKVGDSATYSASASGMDFSMTLKLTAFNSAANTFTKETVTSMMGQEQVESEEVATEDLASDEALSMVMSLCETEMIKGKLATITVAAGTFDTCEIVDESGAVQNLGVVPFGLVKFTSAEVSLELANFAAAL